MIGTSSATGSVTQRFVFATVLSGCVSASSNVSGGQAAGAVTSSVTWRLPLPFDFSSVAFASISLTVSGGLTCTDCGARFSP